MKLRRAVTGDLAALTALQQAAYAPLKARIGMALQPAEADFAAVIADMVVWVAGAPDLLDVAVILDPRPDHLLIWSLAVAPHLKGQGLGGGLMDFAAAEARRLGLGTVRLYTNERFVENIAWYRRRGYAIERIEERPDRRIVHFVRQL
jgi:ribosomal protein S18 acetylase RimI-like enzyme